MANNKNIQMSGKGGPDSGLKFYDMNEEEDKVFVRRNEMPELRDDLTDEELEYIEAGKKFI